MDDFSEYLWVKQAANGMITSAGMWLGGHADAGGTWSWPDGTAFSMGNTPLAGHFTNWGPSQPGAGECLMMVADGRWYSVVCDDPVQEAYVVCEG